MRKTTRETRSVLARSDERKDSRQETLSYSGPVRVPLEKRERVREKAKKKRKEGERFSSTGEEGRAGRAVQRREEFRRKGKERNFFLQQE